MKANENTVDVWVSINRIHKSFMETVELALKKKRLPPLTWYDILWELEQVFKDSSGNTGLRQQELEKSLLFDQGNLSRTVKKMVEAEYVIQIQDPNDKRGRVISITEDGITVRQEIWVIYESHLHDLIQTRLPAEDMKQAARLLQRLR